jgi:hypothetical protein
MVLLIYIYIYAFITLDELEKALKLTKNGETPGQDNINSELMHQKSLNWGY